MRIWHGTWRCTKQKATHADTKMYTNSMSLILTHSFNPILFSKLCFVILVLKISHHLHQRSKYLDGVVCQFFFSCEALICLIWLCDICIVRRTVQQPSVSILSPCVYLTYLWKCYCKCYRETVTVKMCRLLIEWFSFVFKLVK